MSLRGLLNFISGDLERKTLLCVLVPLIFMAYFGTLAFACFWFPGTYDWRYRVISSLISPWNNPEFHWIPSAGITGTGLLMIPFVGYMGVFAYPRKKVQSGISSRLENDPLPLLSILTTTCMSMRLK